MVLTPKVLKGKGFAPHCGATAPGQSWRGLSSRCRLQQAGAGGSCGRLGGTDSDVQDEMKLY